MSKRKLPQTATIPELTNHMLTSLMPIADDPRDCLMGLGVRPTCAAFVVFGMIQKAAKGDTSAAKFLNDISGAGDWEENTDGVSDLHSLSDSILCRLAGIKPEDMLKGEV